ncbi:MAG: hypothetical protein FWB88_03150 [Defluviitaleaceae bacterium]|nr:hypothetical protein [Defluviitaleaceae bacterium]MCL2238453.1 hypothetical protein [Defluviitaleaceae bacterium]
MATQNPVKNFLSVSIKTERLMVLLTLFALLITGVAIGIIRTLPAFEDIIDPRMLRELIVDIPVKAVVGAVPFILLFRDKRYSEWTKDNPDISISKRDFAKGIYHRIFLSSLLSIPVLAIIWLVASVADPDITEYILSIGIFNAGAMFFCVWVMTGLVYTLQFISKNEVFRYVLLYAGLIVAFGLAVALQMLANNVFELPYMSAFTVMGISAIIAAIGLIILLICKPITAKLYEKSEL